MKRRELEKKLRIAGCYLKREGTSHSLWINPKTGIVENEGFRLVSKPKIRTIYSALFTQA
ncbi:MAG: addiction module toxin, HicA family [Bacteroidota bacterium]